jgi:hypothetical protein
MNLHHHEDSKPYTEILYIGNTLRVEGLCK